MTVSTELRRAEVSWTVIRDHVYVPHSEEEYEHLVAFLDQLIDVVGENEAHPLASMMEVIGTLIENYETQHVPEITDL